jgi:uncharacterized protein (DUF2062 family)
VFRRLYAITREVWEQAKHEHSTPGKLGWSVGVGVFAGCTPFHGAHMWIALGLATVFRLNRLWAFLGSRISFTPIFVVIAFCQIQVAHRLRTGAWLPLSPQEALAHGRALLVDWLLGSLVVGGALAIALGLVAYVVARYAQRAPPPGPGDAEAVTARTPAALRLVTSESPRSAPPDPTG